MRESRGTFLQLLAPVAALAIVLLVCRVRRLPLVPTLGLRPPTARAAVAWTSAFVALAVLEEWLSRTVVPGEPAASWAGRYSAAVLAARVLTMVILSPVAEEVVFRGLMFGQLSSTTVGPVGAVAIAAVAFSALHVQYGLASLAFVFVDGLFLGAARATSGSLFLPIGLHALGNAYAAYQRVRPSG